MKMDLEVLFRVMNTFETQKIGPLVQNPSFAQFDLYEFSQIWPTCTIHNLLNFYHMKMILDFLESLRCPLKPLFGFISFEAFKFMYTSLRKYDFLLIFKMTCNVKAHISQMKHFLGKSIRDKVIENWISFKMSFGWGISDKVCDIYAWSKFSLLSLRKP